MTERFGIALTHKLGRVRDEALVCLQSALNQSVAPLFHSVSVARCSRQLTGPAGLVRCTGTTTLCLAESFALVYIVTRWSGSGGVKVDLETLLAGSSDLEM